MKRKRQPPCADRREPGAEGSTAGTPVLPGGCAIRRGVPSEGACGEAAAAAGNRDRHAAESRKVRREREQKLTPKRRGGEKTAAANYFQ